jgi:hypothetical protein
VPQPSRSVGLGALAYSMRRVSVVVLGFCSSRVVKVVTYEQVVVTWLRCQLLGLLDCGLELGAECDSHFEELWQDGERRSGVWS